MPAHTPTAPTLTQRPDGSHHKDEGAHTDHAHGAAEQADPDRLGLGRWGIDMDLDDTALVVDATTSTTSPARY